MDTLLFVYNADSGLANALIDTGRRIFRPEAYPCALCMITYGPFGMKEDWKQFVHSLPYEVRFLHKNELPLEIKNSSIDFPCLIKLHDKKHELLIDNKAFSELRDLATLKIEVNRVLELQS